MESVCSLPSPCAAKTKIKTVWVMDAGNSEGLFYNKQKTRKEKTLKRDATFEYDDDDDDIGNDDSDKSEEEKMKVSTFSGVAGRKGSNGGGGSGLRCCQAEKCAADLTDAKPYYRRHKVCQLHAKSQVVLVAGIRKRFCQQCSRFHELAEFDDTKRSCRRRLAGHNERRRFLVSLMQQRIKSQSKHAAEGNRPLGKLRME